VAHLQWRGTFTNLEVSRLHAEAFAPRVDAERNWQYLLDRHSLGWVVARDGDALVGFVNVVWDGRVHAWLQDTMVARRARGHGVGRQLVAQARQRARAAGCGWLHVDYPQELAHFYEAVCGFVPTAAGLIDLS
jgi:GNAT superfamily N-acetyltransferase